MNTMVKQLKLLKLRANVLLARSNVTAFISHIHRTNGVNEALSTFVMEWIKMRRSRTDHSGLPKNKLPPVPKPDLILFHWSPTKNRNSINHNGLRVGIPSLQGDWKPPYICFCDDPDLAWHLSGKMWPDIDSWDLWMCNASHQNSFDHYELITDTYSDTGRTFTKEYRVYTRVFKRDLRYLATRSNNVSKRSSVAKQANS